MPSWRSLTNIVGSGARVGSGSKSGSVCQRYEWIFNTGFNDLYFPLLEKKFSYSGWSMFLLGKEEGINQLSKLATSGSCIHLHWGEGLERLGEKYTEEDILAEVVIKSLNEKSTSRPLVLFFSKGLLLSSYPKYKDSARVSWPNIYENWPVKVPGGRCLSVWGPRSPPPPSCYTLYEYIPLYLFTQGMGDGGRWISEKVRGALVHKRGRKYQHDWLWLTV